MPDPRMFTMIRKADATGVSGTGRILDGIVFHNGQVVICWRSDINGRKGFSSICIYPSWEAFKHVHIDPHPKNANQVIFSQDPGFVDIT